MVGEVSHNRDDESLDAKARWFQSLTMSERLAAFAEFYNLALALNPDLVRLKDVPAPSACIRVLERP